MMERFKKQTLENIQAIFEERTGVSVITKKRYASFGGKRMVIVMCTMICLLTLSAFAYSKFSDLAGDEVGFCSIYKGDGVFEIVITNSSDKDLELQEQIKVMRWSSGQEVEGDAEKITFENLKIDAHSEETVGIDISKAYDIAALEEPLPAGDWYYFVLTNNDFAFGQDWMCTVSFEENVSEATFHKPEKEISKEMVYPAILRFEEWIWPTVSEEISGPYGLQNNGTFSEHINIAGDEGDEIYAVADGIVTHIGFESTCGNSIVIDLGDGITVQYGHLKKVLVKEGENVKQGQKIGELGKTGMATGPNLSFAVYSGGETVNPLAD